MIDMGWSPTEKAEFFQLCFSTHRVEVEVRVLDMNHNFMGTLSRQLISGGVSMDATADVTRSASLVFLDVNATIQIDPTVPDIGLSAPNRMLQIIYSVGRVDGSKWFRVPVFTGPVTATSRKGWTLNVECLGKDAMSNGITWVGHTFGPGWNRSSLAIAAMRDFGNESTSYMQIEPTTSKTSGPTALNRDISVWAFVKNRLREDNKICFYDGRGVLQGRSKSFRPVFRYGSGTLLDDVQTSYDLSQAINTVEITGAVPPGKSTPIFYRCYAPASHPLSPQSMGRNGKPLFLPRIEQNENITTYAQAVQIGQAYLADGLLQAVDVSFTGVFIPGMEENDMLYVSSKSFRDMFRLTQATLPLVASEAASIGYTKKISVSSLARTLRRA